MLVHPILRVMRKRNGTLGKRLGVRTRGGYPGLVTLQTRPKPGLRSRTQTFHQEMNSDASSSSQLKAAVPAKSQSGRRSTDK